ncbi:hypothetical protein [Anaerotruncus sp.]|jgi:hypothetical protein|uniref:hypothetical protein n=1 Tax=Anaerotruncus TaxID=244127 RepID=UPI0025C5082E|nr:MULTISPECIES: hypothetical protein [Anaerotruncus]
MDKTTKKTYDGLCSDFVFIETQDFEDGTPTTLPHRQMFYNTESGRAMLAEAAPELLDEILAVWGEQAKAMDGAEILGPIPTVEERAEILEQQITDTQMALVEAYEAADDQATTIMLAQTEAYETADRQNTDALLALAEVYESMLALQARVEVLEGGEKANG